MAPESAFCAMLDENIYPQVWRLLYNIDFDDNFYQEYPVHELSFAVFFLIPIILLIFFYTSMIMTIKKANASNIRRSAYRGTRAGSKTSTVKPPADNRKQTIRMLGNLRIQLFYNSD